MSKDPTVLNVTQVFRREQRLWAVGKTFPSNKLVVR